MAIRSAEEIRQDYIKYVLKKNARDLYGTACRRKITEPLFEGYEFHADEEPVKQDVTDVMEQIISDLFTIDTECQGQADDYEALISNSATRLKNIRSKIASAGQKAADLNLLCGYYPEFSTLIDIGELELSGTYQQCNNGSFCAGISSWDFVKLTIKNIEGNGYEGNANVISNGSFLSETTPTNDRGAISDYYLDTVYEYSRLLSDETEGDYAITKSDGQMAACTIEIEGTSSFNFINVYSDSQLVLEDVGISSYGMAYEWQNKKPLKLLEQPNGSSMSITFPQTLCAKLKLKQTTTSADSIGIENSDDSIKLLPEAKRSVLRINNIEGKAAVFYKTSIFKTPELLQTDVGSIAILANEYKPTGSITYVLTVNGTDYDIQPMNSQSSGIKIIRNSSVTSEEDYVATIKDKITSAYLTITINTPNAQETPLLSNVRVCLGGATA